MTNPQQSLAHPTGAQRAEGLHRLQEQRPETLQEALRALAYREYRVLQLRYGLNGEQPRTLDEVGRTFNLTRERIRQIEVKAYESVVTLVETTVRERESLSRRVLDLERRLSGLERGILQRAGVATVGEPSGVPIEGLELGVRAYNCLRRAGITTVDKLVRQSAPALNAIPNFGRKAIDEVTEALATRGLSLAEDPPRPGAVWWEG
ncbi:MAG TPA: DNA-directed RNA polymerase subunit alpha C-terminal domain-containing protein [Solirubrobacteraceae bacterium]